MSESDRVGIDKTEVQKLRAMWAAQLNSLMKRIATLPPNSQEQQQAFEDFVTLNKYVHQFEESLLQKYSVNVLESLDSSIKTLHSSTETLIKSSRRLEFLTSFLFLVAAVSVVETAEIAILPKDQLLLVSILSLVAIGLMFSALWKFLRKSGSFKELS